MKTTIKTLSLLCAALMILSSCQNKKSNEDEINYPDISHPEATQSEIDADGSASAEAIDMPSLPQSLKTVSVGYSENTDGKALLADNKISVSGNGLSANGKILTIIKGGTYHISGTVSDGRIMVNTTDKSEVRLILDGVSITSSDGPAIYVVAAKGNTVLHIPKGSASSLSDVESYATFSQSDQPTATVFSMDDLELEGSGTLYIKSTKNKGIFSKDDLKISDCTLLISSADDCIRGKDSVTLSDMSVTGVTNEDGIRSSNTEAGTGDIYIGGSKIYITSGGDAIQATGCLDISGEEFVLQSGGGHSKGESHYESFRGGNNDSSTEESISKKGIKSEGNLTFSGGKFTIDSADDAIHSNHSVLIKKGDFAITTGDDAIHADLELYISGGVLTATKSYEGLEASKVTIAGGTIDVSADDDGINAASSEENSYQMPGDDFKADEDAFITVSGGYVNINAAGDGVDSNGDITLSGGSLIILGPQSSGNGALDYAGSFYLKGGTLLAAGAAGMAMGVSNPEQYVLNFTARVEVDAAIQITDSSGNKLFGIASPKSLSSVIFSSPELKSEEYNLVINGSTYATATASLTPSQNSMGGMGGPGGMGGGPGGHRPDGNRFPF